MIKRDINYCIFLQSYGLEGVIKDGNIIAACNLFTQPEKHHGVSSLKYHELSLVSSNPSNKILRNRLSELRKTISVSQGDNFGGQMKFAMI